jgi:crossover junction endonuclease EME1
MAPEVISLLSSPEPEPLPRPQVPPRPPTTSLRALTQKWDFSALGESSQAVERIPESSAPTRPVTVTKAPREEFFFDSDDFDITGDLGGGGGDDEQLFLDDRPFKRRRLSEDSLDLPTVRRPSKRAAPTAARPSSIPSSPPRGPKPGFATDPIELLSSPVRPAGPTVRTSNLLGDDIVSSSIPKPLATKKPTVLASDISDFSNPFVSSSPPRATLKPQNRITALSAQTSYAPQQHIHDSVPEEVDEAKIPSLVAMGFADSQARNALRKTGNNVARAIDWLFDHPEDTSHPILTSKGAPDSYVPPKHRPSPKKSVAWDPISSSAPLSDMGRISPSARSAQTIHRSRSEVICLDDSEDDSKPHQKSRSETFAFEDSDSDPKPTPMPRSRSAAFNFDDSDGLSLSDDEFPDDLSKIKARKFSRTISAPTVSKTKPTTSSSTGASKPRTTAAKKTPAEGIREKIAREADKERAKLAREAEKERKKQEKEQAKKEKAAEKVRAAALAEVNKIRTDKKTSTPEMIVDLPSTLPAAVKAQAELLLKDIDVDFNHWYSPVENVVKWRRKVRARYDAKLGHWEPIPLRIEAEKHAMAILKADTFVDLVLAKNDDVETNTLERHVMKLKHNFQDHTLIYLIQGLSTWMKENRNVRNRQFVSAVTGKLTNSESTSAVATSRRKKATPKEYIDEDLIEDALLSLQVRHKVLIHHTRVPIETAKQIAIFTQQLSTLPYKRIKEDMNAASAGFCMESGQVKVGDGVRDTYARMLQEVNRITAPIAYGIIGEFGSVPGLIRGLEAGGPARLEDVRKCADAEGTVVDDARRIGPSVSRRVWGIFTGRDETSMDV